MLLTKGTPVEKGSENNIYPGIAFSTPYKIS